MNKKFFIFIFLLFSAAQTVIMGEPPIIDVRHVPVSHSVSHSWNDTQPPFDCNFKKKHQSYRREKQTQTVSNESQFFPFIPASIAMTIFTGITYVDDMKEATFICGCIAIATIITGIYQTKKKRENGITNHL